MPVIVSKANKSLIVPYRLKSIFPDGQDWFMGPGGMSAIAPPTHLLLPHGMRETLILRHMGFKVPNPMELYYDFPHPQGRAAVPSTKSHMQTTLVKIHGHTFSTIWEQEKLVRCIGPGTISIIADLAGRLLVVCKLSNFRDPWANEAFKIIPGRKVSTITWKS